MIIPDTISDRLLAECLGRPTAYEALRRLCDQVGGRISGAPSGDRAEEWGLLEFGKAGLENVRAEELVIPVWVRGPIQAEVMGESGWRLTAVAHGFCPADCDLSAPVLDAGHGMPEDYDRLGDAAARAAILVDEGAPEGKRSPHRTEKLAWAVEHGAACLMIASSAPGGLPRTGVCHRSGSPIPSIGISLEDGARLQRLLRDGLRMPVRVRMSNRLFDGTARNIVGDLAGTETSEEIVIAGAHLDSWDISQGATDNGLGCAIVLEAARALAASGRRPRRTIRFALWAAEETGLRGSHAYVRDHASELDSIVAVMNFDMTGDPSGYWTPGRTERPSLLTGLCRQLAPLGMREEISSSVVLHSDHQPFMLAGVPIVAVSGKLPDGGGGHYYHSVGDTFEKVSLPGLCRTAAVAAHTLWALADAPERTYARLTSEQVDAMVDKAGLREALEAE